jgi:anti-sigma regulatory factor (Ser/Thr protein kinase)
VDRLRRELEPRPESAAVARRWVADVLTARDLEHLVDTAGLLVSELVTNALCHSSGPYEVSVGFGPHSATVTVSDSARGRPHRGDPARLTERDPVGDVAEHGRGLLLVAALADSWGWQGTPHGKRVWFRLDADG